MNQTGLWKKLLPGFIPVIVFVVADEVWGTIPGLIVAITTGILELAWTGWKERRFDKFILFDTLLLVVLGGISILLDNELFFMLKPGLIGILFLLILGVSAFSSLDVVGVMTRRYMKDVSVSAEQAAEMRKNLRVLFWIVFGHTLLVFYSAWYLPKTAWAFISGGLLYILVGLYFVFQLLKIRQKRKQMAGEEWLPLVDEEGKITGKATRREVHSGSRLLHPVVHLHVLNLEKSVLLQKRPVWKDIQPGKWDTAVGGHIAAGETLEQALKRETAEETGLTGVSARFLKSYIWESDVEKELVYLFVTWDFRGYKVQSGEVDELRFWTKHEVERNLGKDVFTPNFEHDYRFLKSQKMI